MTEDGGRKPVRTGEIAFVLLLMTSAVLAGRWPEQMTLGRAETIRAKVSGYSSLEMERLRQTDFATQAGAIREEFSCIEEFYNSWMKS